MNKNSGEKHKKKLIVKKIDHFGSVTIQEAEGLLEKYAGYQMIDTINWSAFSYKPSVKFKIAYWNNQIWLKFYIKEKTVRAQVTEINGDVYKDSCVEFFISPNRNSAYYNFEFNCIGVPHLGYGKGREGRKLINSETVSLVQTKSSLGNVPFEEKIEGKKWEIMIVIPRECFVFDHSLSFKGLKASANFYKCADETRSPHFLTWSPIDTESPDYHQPGCFGELQFEG